MAQTKSIYIYGASGHGKVIVDIALDSGYKEVIFIDDNKGLKFSESLEKFDMIIAIGDNQTRSRVQQKVESFGFNVVNLVHSSAVISKSAKLGKGVVVMPNAVINAEAKIGDGVIINSGAIVEHECRVGKFAHLSPNVSLAGNVEIGEFTHMGIGSVAIQGVKIGKNAIIGAGTVVIRDIKDDVTAVGVPAKIIKNL
ncbi:MAG: acetyltransferase [Campylobacteraceae bacterium]|nr:acetyltransferase [Campylobacteraceae bacterium]